MLITLVGLTLPRRSAPKLTYIPAHIGGFLMGLLAGMVFYPIISASRRHQIVTWILRIAAIPLAVVLFVVLIRNFYTSDPYAGMLAFISCL